MTTQSSHGPVRRTLRPEQLQHELALARAVQQSLYPASLPSLANVRLAACNHAARIVSGDLYDVIKIDPERIAILCADVSGKGFAAALLASEVHAYVRSTLRAACVFADPTLGSLPVQVVTLLNTEFSRRNASGRYATMFFGEFDASTRSLCYVNAGHNPPLLFTDGGVSELAVGGPPVGLFEDSAYDAGTVTVPEGGTVLIYTDGVVEARNAEDEELGLARLVEMCAAAYRDVEGLPAIIMAAVQAWASAIDQEDDITLIVLGVE
jgi:sigma-B regulation protein RsbU (phosphoserine phosphatase)